MTLFRDERGNLSAARSLLAAEIIYLWVVGPALSDTLVAGHFGLCGFFIAWAAGPRGLQYLGPQIAAFTKAIGDRVKGTDNAKKDDER